MRIGVIGAALCLCFVGIAQAQSAHASIRKDLNVPSEPLGSALQEVAKTYELQLLYHTELAKDLKTQGAIGSLTPDEALTKVLSGTGLSYKFLDSNTITVFASPAPSGTSAAAGQTQTTQGGDEKKDSSRDFRLAQVGQANTGPQAIGSDEDSEKKKQEGLTEIVVTGTHIRGAAPESSPVSIYTREDIEKSGARTLDQFARLIPENFSSSDATSLNNPTSSGVSSAFDQNGGNVYGGAAFNLHGLGPNATLVLLNGNRMAPSGSNGSFVDISMIPVSAIDRIEILDDGASAIYGADAVAGVVNIILRNDFRGAETSARIGGTTGGGAGSLNASQLLGTSWSGGSGLLVYDYDKQDRLLSTQRNFIPAQPLPAMVVPQNLKNSVLGNANQQLWEGGELSAQGFFSRRDFVSDIPINAAPSAIKHNFGKNKEYGGGVSFRQDLFSDWQVNVSQNYSTSAQTYTSYLLGVPPSAAQNQTFPSRSILSETGIRADGTIFNAPGGKAKASVGAGLRVDTLEIIDVTGAPAELSRRIQNVSAEALIPFVGPSNAMPGFKRLELSLAGRFDHYSDVGSTTNPKIGLLFSPLEGFNLRASYSRAFRAPNLADLVPYPIYLTLGLPDPTAVGGTTDTLINANLGNPDLKPERSRSITAGFDFKPVYIPGLSISASYFDIAFKDRISNPPLVGGLFSLYSQATQLAPFINRSPNLADVTAIFNGPGFFGDNAVDSNGNALGAAGVQAIFNDTVQNISSTQQSGIDASANYSMNTPFGNVGFSLAASYLLKMDFETVAGAPYFSILNQYGEPIRLKLNTGLSWRKSGWGANASVNYWGHYENTAVTPTEEIASWTVLNTQLSYEFEHENSPLIRGLQIAFDIQNITNKSPPYAAAPVSLVGPGWGYDPANASALGRAWSVQLRKAW